MDPLHYTPFEGIPEGVKDSVNRTFMLRNGDAPLTILPAQVILYRNFPLAPGAGYSPATLVKGRVQIVLEVAPDPGDALYAQGWLPVETD
jgi:hypothetical protein